MNQLLGGRVNTPQAVDKAADAAAAVAAAAAGTSWVAQTNEILTLVATIVAILSGVFALAYHYRRWRRERAAHKRDIQRATEEVLKQMHLGRKDDEGSSDT